MVRPEGRALIPVPHRIDLMPSCVGLAGGSPAAVSVGAPRSRSRVGGEISSSERDVKCPPGSVRLPGGERNRGPSMKRTLQPREIRARKGGMAEPIMTRRRQQTVPGRAGAVQDIPGVWRRARGDSPARNRRDPTRGYTSYRFSLRIDNGPWISVPKDKPTLIDEIDAGTKHLLTLREDERVVESFWFTFDWRGSSELCFGYGYFHQTWQLHPPRGRKGCGCRSEAAG